MNKRILRMFILGLFFVVVCGTLGYYFIINTNKPHTNTKEEKALNDNATNPNEHRKEKQDVTSIPLEKPPFVKGE